MNDGAIQPVRQKTLTYERRLIPGIECSVVHDEALKRAQVWLEPRPLPSREARLGQNPDGRATRSALTRSSAAVSSPEAYIRQHAEVRLRASRAEKKVKVKYGREQRGSVCGSRREPTFMAALGFPADLVLRGRIVVRGATAVLPTRLPAWSA